MKTFLSALTGVGLFAFPAQAEFSFNTYGRATGLYGYTDAEKRFEDVDSKQNATGDFEAGFEARYDFNDDYALSLNLDLMGGIDHELKNYNQGAWGEEAYGIFDSPYGRLMGGQTFNVAKQFHVGAPSYGPLKVNDSDIVDFIRNPNWKRTSKEAYFATLNATDINTDGVAPKISYITPEFYHTLLGFSYIPDTYNRRGLVNKDARYAKKDGYAAAAYNSLDLGFADMTSSAGYAEFHDNDKEFSLGLNLARGNWNLGGSWRKTYIDGADAPLSTRSKKKDLPALFDNYREGRAWDVGIGYEFGPYCASLSYLNSKAENTRNYDQIVILSNSFQVNKYLDLYAIGSFAKFRGEDRDIEHNNQGYAFVTGASLSF